VGSTSWRRVSRLRWKARVPAPDWAAGIPGVRRDEPLARHSQFGIGGPADWFLKIRDAALLADLLPLARRNDLEVTVLGAGSNTLILDGGIRGLVIRIDDRHTRRIHDGCLELAAGCMLPRVALDCAREGIAGLEFGIGVPGTCGASVFGNAGAFGTEIKDVLLECTVLSPVGGAVTLSNADCGFAYRHSRLKDDLLGHVVVSARLRVRPDQPDAVTQRTRGVQRRRKETQPIGVRSLGSVFKNPPGDTAGRLIEACGLKGIRQGGAEIATKHANFIVNAQSATAVDVLALIDLARDEVRRRFGVELEREVIVLGEAKAPVSGAGVS
jgi:UDP-N-acetylmuramate dehydrogenase